jgi:hypothetical protein
MREIAVQRVCKDEGTVVVFAGYDVQGDTELVVRFAVDSHAADDIVRLMIEQDEPVVLLEDWMVL